MEDAARLALIEQYLNNDTAFENLLKQLLLLVNRILDNPHDHELRKIKDGILKPLLPCEVICSYLKYIGFEYQSNVLLFPQEQTLSKLKSARTAIEQKIIYCYGPEKLYCGAKVRPRKKTIQLTPTNVLTTTNTFLQSIQKMFNHVLMYEDEEVLDLAYESIPLLRLQLRACERMREHQKKIKTGEFKGEDMSYEMALLAELVCWFKHEFFKWVDKPPCTFCGGATRMVTKVTRVVEGESCRVEEYECKECGRGGTSFPRHNSPRVLLRTRRGRCGEFANCFTLMCRAVGYDTRYVYDTSDHVWCEVFDYDRYSWVHADPCEAQINAPLLYSHGWKKQLSYVIGLSRDDLQDVTWRYTTQHNEVLARRNLCSEAELVGAILELRAHRQAQVSAPRRRHLAERVLRELVQLQVERKPEDFESQGRLSGSLEWRQQRGEAGAADEEYVFQFDKPGNHVIRYYTSIDEYRISSEGPETRKTSWRSAVFDCERVFRKLETDWKQVYLAREEGEDSGLIAWKISRANKNMAFRTLIVRATTALYETGRIDWTLQFDDQDPMVVKLNDSPVLYRRNFNSVVIKAELSGGVGGVAWQHAQLFRQPLDSDVPTFEIHTQMVEDDNIDSD